MKNYKSLYHPNFIKLIKSENLEEFDINIWDFFWRWEIPFYYYDKIIDKSTIPEKIKKLYKNQTVRNLVFLELLKEFKTLLEHFDIEYFLYKGIWLIENIYKTGVRSIDDIDILINSDSLKKMETLLNSWGVEFDRDFFKQNSNYHETRIDIKKWKIPLFIDIHKDIAPFGKIKNFHSVFTFDTSHIIEKQLILLLIELGGDFFKNEKRFLDVLEIIDNCELDWSYIFEIVIKLKLKNQFVYLFYTIESIIKSKINFLYQKKFDENFNFYKIKVKKIVEKSKIKYFFIKNLPIFEKKRLNQLLLPQLQFDSTIDYIQYFFKKTIYTIKNGDLWREIQKFKVELGEK